MWPTFSYNIFKAYTVKTNVTQVDKTKLFWWPVWCGRVGVILELEVTTHIPLWSLWLL